MARRRPIMHADPRADTAYCRNRIRTGSKSFFLAAKFLPGPLRDAVHVLYAFCREADDAIDGGADPFAALDHFEQRLSAIYGNAQPAHPVDRALARVAAAYALPRELLEALLQGFAWDARSRSYRDLPGVYGYSVRVAGSVGILMALLMGVRDAALLARAADLGVAMQLTNIARDVGEDARAGRLYLPLRWLREANLSPAQLVPRPRFSAELAGVVARLLSAADGLYARADAGIAGLPARYRPGIYAARRLYAEIGNELLRRGADSISRRTVVPWPRKLALAGRALLPVPACPAHLHAAPLPQVRYLIRAVGALPATPPPEEDRRGLASDVEWVLDLFAELKRRDRESHA